MSRNFQKPTQSRRFYPKALPGTYEFRPDDRWPDRYMAKGPGEIPLKPTMYFHPEKAPRGTRFELTAHMPNNGNARELFVEPTDKINLASGVWTHSLETITDGMVMDLVFQEVPDKKDEGKTFTRAFTKGGHLVTLEKGFVPKLGQKAKYLLNPDREGISARATGFADGSVPAENNKVGTNLGALLPSAVRDNLVVIEVQRVIAAAGGGFTVTKEKRSAYAEIGISETDDRRKANSIYYSKLHKVEQELRRLTDNPDSDPKLVKKYELWGQNLRNAWRAIHTAKRALAANATEGPAETNEAQASEAAAPVQQPERKRNRRHGRPGQNRSDAQAKAEVPAAAPQPVVTEAVAEAVVPVQATTESVEAKPVIEATQPVTAEATVAPAEKSSEPETQMDKFRRKEARRLQLAEEAKKRTEAKQAKSGDAEKSDKPVQAKSFAEMARLIGGHKQ